MDKTELAEYVETLSPSTQFRVMESMYKDLKELSDEFAAFPVNRKLDAMIIYFNKLDAVRTVWVDTLLDAHRQEFEEDSIQDQLVQLVEELS